MIKLLFTGGGGAGNEAIYHLLQGRYETHFADADVRSIDPSIPAECRHAIPLANAADFAHALARLVRRLGIDLLVPGVDEELPLLARDDGTGLLLPDPVYVTAMLDKLETARRLAAAGLDHPRTVLGSEVDRWDLFPCIAKPRTGRGSRNVHLVHSAKQFSAYLGFTGLSPDDVVLQERVVGQEYTVMMAADTDANLRAVVPVRVDFKRGITIRATTDADARVLDACRAIHGALPTRGCYNIQAMLADQGRLLPFEINPRVSTTLCLGLAAGVDPFSIYLCDQPGTALRDFRTGLSLQRVWTNHFSP